MKTLTSAPQYINWNYTYLCNFLCSHCYSRSDKYPTELSSNQYKLIAKQIVDNEIFAVGFGGGEPVIRKDLLETIEFLSKNYVDTHLISNGWFLDVPYLKNLASIGLGMLAVSIDSPEKVEHDLFRLKKGSFEKAIIAAKRAVDVSLNTFFSTVINATNYKRIPDFVKLAEDCGINGISFKIFRPVGFGELNRKKYELNNDQLNEVIRLINELQMQTKIRLSIFQGEDNVCSCGITQLTIRPNGDISICPYDDNIIGNLIESDLIDIWNNSKLLKTRRCENGSCKATNQNYLINSL